MDAPPRQVDNEIARLHRRIDELLAELDERKRGELLLHESEREFKTIFDAAGTGMSMVHLVNGETVRTNRELQKIFGCIEVELGRLETYDQLTYEPDRE